MLAINEWDDIRIRMRTLAGDIEAYFDNGCDAWIEHEDQSLCILPKGVFLWLDAFEREWSLDQVRHPLDEAGEGMLIGEINLSVEISPKTFALVMDGFINGTELPEHAGKRVRMKWTETALKALFDLSNQPGMTEEKLANKYEMSRQAINKQLNLTVLGY